MEPNTRDVQMQTLHTGSKKPFFILGTGIAILVCLALYFSIIGNEQKNLTEENNAKTLLIESLNKEIETKTVSLEQLNLTLHDTKEKLVTLEREMTTFNDHENVENLINRNSLIKTLQDLELRSHPDTDSEIKYEIGPNMTGEIIDGPRLIGDEVWWKVSFRSGEEGWVHEALLVRVPSVVIKIDTDKDGVSDVKIRWEGDYDLDGIVATQGVDGTYIRYKGKAMPEPYKVIEL
jgi:hypothetical protein